MMMMMCCWNGKQPRVGTFKFALKLAGVILVSIAQYRGLHRFVFGVVTSTGSVYQVGVAGGLLELQGFRFSVS
jgi:hypothetical protein